MWQLEIPVPYIYPLLFHILFLMKNRFSKDNRLVYSSVITSPLPYRYFMKSCSYCCKSHLQHYWLAEIPVSLANDFSRSSYWRIHNSPLIAEPPQGVSPIRCECHYMLTADSGFSNCQGTKATSAFDKVSISRIFKVPCIFTAIAIKQLREEKKLQICNCGRWIDAIWYKKMNYCWGKLLWNWIIKKLSLRI